MKCKFLYSLKSSKIEEEINNFLTTENVTKIHHVESDFLQNEFGSSSHVTPLGAKTSFSFIFIYE